MSARRTCSWWLAAALVLAPLALWAGCNQEMPDHGCCNDAATSNDGAALEDATQGTPDAQPYADAVAADAFLPDGGDGGLLDGGALDGGGSDGGSGDGGGGDGSVTGDGGSAPDALAPPKRP